MENTHNCVENSICFNTDGGFFCFCAPGFDGIGTIACTGKSPEPNVIDSKCGSVSTGSLHILIPANPFFDCAIWHQAEGGGGVRTFQHTSVSTLHFIACRPLLSTSMPICEGFQCKTRYIHFVKFSGQAAQIINCGVYGVLYRNPNFERDCDCNLSRSDL